MPISSSAFSNEGTVFIERVTPHNEVCNINFLVYTPFQKVISESLKTAREFKTQVIEI